MPNSILESVLRAQAKVFIPNPTIPRQKVQYKKLILNFKSLNSETFLNFSLLLISGFGYVLDLGSWDKTGTGLRSNYSLRPKT